MASLVVEIDFLLRKRLICADCARIECWLYPALSVTVYKQKDSYYQSDGIQLALLVIKETIEMRKINYKGKIGGAILGFSLVLGIGIVSSVTAQAQDRNDGQWQRRDRNRSDSQDQNRDWRRDRDQNRARRDDRYDRDNGYGNNGSYDRNTGYGNNGRYDRNRGYGNNGGYNNGNQLALNQGYQAGLNTGASDAQRGQSYSPQRSHYYRDASSQPFRNGFVQGYDAGFRQYGGYNNNGVYRRGNTGSGIGSILSGILGRP